MSLTLVATPIGNPEDITLRALNALKAADVVVGEEFKEVSRLLKTVGITGKTLLALNEHSRTEDIQELFEACREGSVALVSDCGTPGFCDPGFQLVKLCREAGIAVTSAPGASSLMTMLSLSSQRLDRFRFEGFLPRESEDRQNTLRSLQKESCAIVLMDTPYRLGKLLDEVEAHFSERRILLGLDLTQSTEKVLEGTPVEVSKAAQGLKAEFVMLIYPEEKSGGRLGEGLSRNSHHSRPRRN